MKNKRLIKLTDKSSEIIRFFYEVIVLVAISVFMAGSVIFAVYITSSVSKADSFIINGASYHFDRSKDRNESNLGLGYKKGLFVAGWFENSHYKKTKYAGLSFQHKYTRYFGIGLDALLVSGYTEHELKTPRFGDYNVTPFPYFIFGYKTQINVGIVPSDQGAITLSLEYKF